MSLADFNQMVLPALNQTLRARVTQRFEKKPTKKVLSKLVQLLVAEICYNLDLEALKQNLEMTRGGFSTQMLFKLIDLRDYKYLDVEGIRIFMEEYHNCFVMKTIKSKK